MGKGLEIDRIPYRRLCLVVLKKSDEHIQGDRILELLLFISHANQLGHKCLLYDFSFQQTQVGLMHRVVEVRVVYGALAVGQ